jgi:hypothetical protein
MKKQVLTLVGVLSLVLAAGSAFAQSGDLRFTVPFNFIVSGSTMPAGDYMVSTMGGANQILVLRATNGSASTAINANHIEASKPCNTTKLVFRHYGDRYFLAQVWKQGDDRGRQLPKSNLESEIARDFSRQGDVELVARLR